MIRDKEKADGRSFIVEIYWKTPMVRVCSPKKSATPKSFIVSINARAKPAAMPGRAMGMHILKKHCQGVFPIVFAASINLAEKFIMAILVSR